MADGTHVAEHAQKRVALLARIQVSLAALGESRPIVAVGVERNGEFKLYFRAPKGQMLGVGLATRLPDDPESAALRALELLPLCVPFDPNVITGRRRLTRRKQKEAIEAAAVATSAPQASKPSVNERMAKYIETLQDMLDDVGEPAINAILHAAKAVRATRLK